MMEVNGHPDPEETIKWQEMDRSPGKHQCIAPLGIVPKSIDIDNDFESTEKVEFDEVRKVK